MTSAQQREMFDAVSTIKAFDGSDALYVGVDVKRFVESFDVLAQADGGIARLRDLVLHLALRGALVAQDPADGVGSNALNRCRDARETLVAAGRMRPARPATPVGANESFPVPGSWVWTRFGEIGDWGAGATPSRTNSNYYGGATPWFKSGELNDAYVDDSEEHVTDLALRECSLRTNQPGDVLIAMYGATIGKVAIVRSVSTTNQAVCACTCFDGIDNEFLLRVLKATRIRFVAQGAGGAQPNISKIKIVETPCPLPPLAEQKRIVGKVDELMRLIDDLEAKQTKKRDVQARLRTAALDALSSVVKAADLQAAWTALSQNFGVLFERAEAVGALRTALLFLALAGVLVQREAGPQSNVHELLKRTAAERMRLLGSGSIDKTQLPKRDEAEYRFPVPSSWALPRLDDVAYVVDPNPSHRNPLYVSEGFPFISTQEFIGREGLLLETPRRVAEATMLEQESRCALSSRSILFSRKGTIGKTRIFPGGARVALLDSLCVVNAFAAIDARYLNYALRSPQVRRQIEEMSRGLALPQISVGRVRLLRIPLPCEREQERIVAKLDYLMRLCDDLESKLERSEAIAAKVVEALVPEMVV